MSDDKYLVEYITGLVMTALGEIEMPEEPIKVGISARHIHLQREHLDALFGKDYQLTLFKKLSQPEQFAANEMVTLIGPKGEIGKVRVLGPERVQTQVELTLSDARKIGLNPPVRSSGHLKGTPGIKLRSAYGEVELTEGVIIADRHIHMTLQDAKRFGVQDGEKVNVIVDGVRGGILGNVTIRANEKYALDFHVDTDDANAFMLKQGQIVHLEKVR